MKTARKTIAPLLLALAMVLGVAPAASAAEGSAGQIVSQGLARYYSAAGDPVTDNPVLGQNAVVSVSKTISGTDAENEFLVALEVKTTLDVTEVSESSDAAVVLALDVSNSMVGVNPDGINYMPDLISACKSFIDSYADANGAARYAALVTFGNDGRIRLGWTDVSTPEGYDAMINSVNGLTAEGSTAMESGLQLARNLLRVEALPVGNDGLPIQNRSVIVFSDGEANMNPSNLTNNSVAYSTGTAVYGSGVQFNDPNNNPAPARCEAMADVIKHGTSFYISPDAYSKHTANIYTVAFGSLAPAAWLGSNIATDSAFAFQAGGLAGLESAFAEIIRRIESWAEAWITTDPMGPGVEFASGIPQEDLDSGLLAFEDNTLYWNLKKASEESFVDNIYTYRYAYRVRLNTADPAFTPETPYPVNGATELTYVMVGEDGLIVSGVLRAEYDVPEVKGYGGSLNFVKVGPDGEALEGCVFEVKNTAYPDAVFTAVSAPGTGAVSFALPSGQTYSLKEIAMPSGYESVYALSAEEYTVTVSGGQTTILDSQGAAVSDGFDFVNPRRAKKVDKTALDELIARIERNFATGEYDKYTKDSVLNLLKVLDDAKKVSADDDATQEEVDDAYDKLLEADTNLIYAHFSCTVNSMLAKIGKLQKIPYITYDGYGPLKFTSSQPDKCGVDSDGTLFPLNVGIAVITITAPFGVNPQPPNGTPGNNQKMFAVSVSA